MAGAFNKVILMGNLVKDPELRYTPQGTAVTDIRLAINDVKSRNAQERTATFVDVTLWERSAEVVCEFMRKGSSILIEGRLVTDTWDDRESGKKMSRLKVVAQGFQFTDSRGGGEGGGDYSSAPSSGGGGQYQQRGGGSGGAAPRSGGSGGGRPGGQREGGGAKRGGSAQAPQDDDFGMGGFPADEGMDDIPF